VLQPSVGKNLEAVAEALSGGKRQVDVAGVAEQLKQWGATADVIKGWSQAQEPEEVEVYACNMPTVRIFQSCQLTWLVGMAGATCLGLSMLEIRAALDIYAATETPDIRAEIASGLVLMGRVAARCLNKGR